MEVIRSLFGWAIYHFECVSFQLDTISLLTCMYLQLGAYEPYRNNYIVVEPHADNLELLYFPSTNARVCMCIKTHSSVNDYAATAVYQSYSYNVWLRYLPFWMRVTPAWACMFPLICHMKHFCCGIDHIVMQLMQISVNCTITKQIFVNTGYILLSRFTVKWCFLSHCQTSNAVTVQITIQLPLTIQMNRTWPMISGVVFSVKVSVAVLHWSFRTSIIGSHQSICASWPKT